MSTPTNKPYLTYTDSPEVADHLPATAVKKLQRGWEITQQLVALNSELKTIKNSFEDQYGATAKLVLPAEKCSLTISEATTVSIADFDDLNCLTGEKVEVYANIKVTHTPTKKYKDAILDPDHDMHELLIDTAKLKTTTSSKFLAIR